MRADWTILVAACILPASVCPLQAQGRAAASVRSTLAGVYTEAQAARGRDTFAGMCQACHTPATHTGPVFLSHWGGRPLWDLFDFLRQNMPQSDPGSLSLAEYAQVMAYVLKLNGMPPGARELPVTPAGLRAIRFDTAPAPPTKGMRPWSDER